MEPQAEIVTTVAVALIAATAAGYLVVVMRLATIVGYMLAGVALSPFTPGFSANRDVARQLATAAIGPEDGEMKPPARAAPGVAMKVGSVGSSG